MSGDIAAAWIEQRCRSSAFRDIAWDRFCQCQGKQVLDYYESVQCYVNKLTKLGRCDS